MFLHRQYKYRNYCSYSKYVTCFVFITLYYNFIYKSPKLTLKSKSYYAYVKYIGHPPNLGQGGKAANLTDLKEIELARARFKLDSFNVLLSNRISLNRSVPDNRPKECLNIEYDDVLPTASVIIVYNNEAFSAIIRLIFSLINRSPSKYLHEIILYDDISDKEELKKPLADYVHDNFNTKLVKIFRSTKRLGLIRAKIEGAKHASGDVLVFLDAHCEVGIGWLEPILQRVKQKPNVVLCPIIDAIDDNTLEFSTSSGVAQGGFTWSLHFTWIPLTPTAKKHMSSPADPFPSPTMAGGLLAVGRKFFWHVGAYDPGMEIWGGENLEMSFRVWQCHGELEFLPCSRVGHIYRATHPFLWPKDKQDTHGKNSLRMARVWMDDYIRLYFNHRLDLKNATYGDVSKRKELRQKLNCHNFEWYLKNVYPEKFVPDVNVSAYGKVKNEEKSMCFDMLGRDLDSPQNLGLYDCQDFSSEQLFSWALDGRLRSEDSCAFVTDPAVNEPIVLSECDGGNNPVADIWEVKRGGHIKHVTSGLCIDKGDLKPGKDAFLNTCNSSSATQKWLFQNYYGFDEDGNFNPSHTNHKKFFK